MDEALLRAIREAFPEGRPPDRPVTGHRCPECEETDRLLGGRTWPDVAADFPHYCHDTFPLLTPAAKVYYLPAYLCYEVRSPGYMAGASVRDTLEQGRLPREAFTPAQRAAIASWAEAYYDGTPGGGVPADLLAYWRAAGG